MDDPHRSGVPSEVGLAVRQIMGGYSKKYALTIKREAETLAKRPEGPVAAPTG